MCENQNCFVWNVTLDIQSTPSVTLSNLLSYSFKHIYPEVRRRSLAAPAESEELSALRVASWLATFPRLLDYSGKTEGLVSEEDHRSTVLYLWRRVSSYDLFASDEKQKTSFNRRLNIHLQSSSIKETVYRIMLFIDVSESSICIHCLLLYL